MCGRSIEDSQDYRAFDEQEGEEEGGEVVFHFTSPCALRRSISSVPGDQSLAEGGGKALQTPNLNRGFLVLPTAGPFELAGFKTPRA